MKTTLKFLALHLMIFWGASAACGQITVLPAAQIRFYTGIVVQSSTSGQTVKGVLNIEVDVEGHISIQTSINATTNSYFGVILPAAFGSHARTGVSYIRSVNPQNMIVPGSSRIPLFIQKSAVYGGIMNKDGTSLVFRAERADGLPTLN